MRTARFLKALSKHALVVTLVASLALPHFSTVAWASDQKDGNQGNKFKVAAVIGGVVVVGLVASLVLTSSTSALCGAACADYTQGLKTAREKLITALQPAQSDIASASIGCAVISAPVSTAQKSIINLQRLDHQASAQTSKINILKGTASHSSASLRTLLQEIGIPEAVAEGGGGAEEQMVTEAQTLAKTLQSAGATATGTPPYPPNTGCQVVGPKLTASSTGINQAATQLQTAINKVKTASASCTGSGKGTSAFDKAKSLNVANGGAVAGAPVGEQFAGTPTGGSVADLGAAACANSATTSKWSAQKGNSARGVDGANKTNINEFHLFRDWNNYTGSGGGHVQLRVAPPPMRKDYFELLKRGSQRVASWIRNGLLGSWLPGAVASDVPPVPAICGKKDIAGQDFIDCALGSDPKLAAFYAAMPGGVNGFLSDYERKFGINRTELLRIQPFSPEKMITLMTRDYPEIRVSLMRDFIAMMDSAPGGAPGMGDSQLAQDLAPAPTLGVETDLPKTGTDGVADIGSASTESRAPAAESDPVSAEGVHTNSAGSLFDIVGARYRQELPQVEAKDWALEFNRFSNR